MQSKLDKHITVLGANVQEVTVTGNTKYDQTYATVTDEEKEQLGNMSLITQSSYYRGR